MWRENPQGAGISHAIAARFSREERAFSVAAALCIGIHLLALETRTSDVQDCRLLQDTCIELLLRSSRSAGHLEARTSVRLVEVHRVPEVETEPAERNVAPGESLAARLNCLLLHSLREPRL